MRRPFGLIACAASANLFWIKGKALFTPSLKTGCLDGTTRAAILRLSPIPVHEIDAEITTLEDADALFLTNSRLSIHPVISLQPIALNFNPEHPLIRQLQDKLSNDRFNIISENSAYWENHL